MLDINFSNCKECGSVASTICDLDDRIGKLSKNTMLSITILSPKKYKDRELKNLIRYRAILENLFWNSSYYERDYREILSKIKSLI